jgi:hypothetical protein
LVRRRGKTLIGALALAGTVALLTAAAAPAHLERSAYWPDPAVDNSAPGGAGGKIPKAKSLASALRGGPQKTRVVCKNNSLALLSRAINKAKRKGTKIRPTVKRKKLKPGKARRLMRLNRRLKQRCKFKSIQAAVNASGNNDRVVIMPGIYTEPKSRKAPTNDPACAAFKEENDTGNPSALSYEHQVKCPNDQNLIAVIGRRLGTGVVPQPAPDDRHGIPNLGPCIRCNLQMEGSGVSADDVVVDAGRVRSRNHGPANPVKDVVIRADRADGFVARNMTVRHAREHGFYILETDGYLLSHFKGFYNEEYAVLTFVSDHGVMQHCDAVGSGDSGLYPGAGPETGEQTIESTQRYNQQVRFCDSHHNTSGYSGTDGNGVWIHHNNFYGNALGFTTDVFTAANHPGFPQDSDLIEKNKFYSNNFNPYLPKSDVEPTIPAPVGTGMWIAGGNNNIVRNNRFYDNWRRGAMLFGVPDAFVSDCEDVPGCDAMETNTSYRNEFRNNIMGRTPAGKRKPNGTDFWWDDVIGQTNNCWIDNLGKLNTEASVTYDPANFDDHASNCATSDGTQALLAGPQQQELVNCVAGAPICTWNETPPKPSP